MKSGVYQIIPDAFASFKHILSEFVYYLPAAYHFYAAVIYDSTKGCIRIRLQIRQLYIKINNISACGFFIKNIAVIFLNSPVRFVYLCCYLFVKLMSVINIEVADVLKNPDMYKLISNTKSQIVSNGRVIDYYTDVMSKKDPYLF